MLQDKKVRTNLVYLILLYIINYLFPFLTIPYLSRIFASEHYGVVLYCASFIAYFNILCDYGFNLTGIKEAALQANNRDRLNELVSTITIIKVAIFCLCLVLSSAIIFLVPKFAAYWDLYLISMFSLLNNIFFPGWFFRGVEQMKFVTLIGVLLKTVTVLLIFMFIHRDEQYYLVPYINTISSIICAITAQIILFKQFKFRYVLPTYANIVYHIKSAWYYFISNIATSLYGASNAFLLGIFSTPTAVAFFVPAEKMVAACIEVIGVVSQSIFPSVVRQVHTDKETSVKLLQKNFYGFLFLGASLSISIWIFSPIIVKILLGEKYYNTVFVLRVLAILPLVTSVNNVLAIQTMIPFGFNASFTKVLLFAGCLNIILILLLVPQFSYKGSAVAVAISETVIPALMGYVLYKRGIHVWIGKIK